MGSSRSTTGDVDFFVSNEKRKKKSRATGKSKGGKGANAHKVAGQVLAPFPEQARREKDLLVDKRSRKRNLPQMEEKTNRAHRTGLFLWSREYITIKTKAEKKKKGTVLS